MKPLTYEERSKYCCDVCGNVPDEDGVIEHGKGCYTQSEDGGGTSCVEFDPPGEAIMAEPGRYDKMAAKLIGLYPSITGQWADDMTREVAVAMRQAAADATERAAVVAWLIPPVAGESADERTQRTVAAIRGEGRGGA